MGSTGGRAECAGRQFHALYKNGQGANQGSRFPEPSSLRVTGPLGLQEGVAVNDATVVILERVAYVVSVM